MGESPRAMECFSDNPNRGTADKIGKMDFLRCLHMEIQELTEQLRRLKK